MYTICLEFPYLKTLIKSKASIFERSRAPAVLFWYFFYPDVSAGPARVPGPADWRPDQGCSAAPSSNSVRAARKGILATRGGLQPPRRLLTSRAGTADTLLDDASFSVRFQWVRLLSSAPAVGMSRVLWTSRRTAKSSAPSHEFIGHESVARLSG